MRFTIQQMLMNVSAARDKEAISAIFAYIADSLSTVALNSAGLVIKAGGGVLAKTGASDFYAIVKGVLVKITAATDMPALTGLTITANKFNVACFFVDQTGTTSVLFGTEGGTIGTLKFPDFPVDKALVGFLLITHSATFTGNTTPLDTATTVFFSPVSGVDPTVLFS